METVMNKKDSTQIEHVIVDTDCADDDLFAISLLIYAHLRGVIKLCGITPVLGIRNVFDGAVVMRRLLTSVGLQDEVPICMGADSPLVPNRGHYFTEAEWWSVWDKPIKDLPDNAGFSTVTEDQISRTEHGVDFLQRMINTQKNLSILVLGPLTNLALLAQRDPSIFTRVNRISMMGGNVTAAGNTPNMVSEWNFYADPFAVKVFMENISTSKVYMCGLEIANFGVISREQQLHLAKISTDNIPDPVIKRLVEIMQKLIVHSEAACSFDPVAAAVFLNDTLYEFREQKLKVETEPPVEAKLRIALPEDKEGVGTMFVAVGLNEYAYYELLKDMMHGK